MIPPEARSRAEQVLRDIPQALLVLQADRRLVFANRTAEQYIRDGQLRDIAGRLMEVGHLGARTLEELLRLAQGGHPSQAGVWFSPRQGTGWLSVTQAPAAMTQSANWPADCLLMLVHCDQPELSQAARIEAICKQCQLTRTERYVLLLLVDGVTVQDVADQLLLQVSTIRSHVRNLLGKTRAPSLMQLLRQVGGSGQPLNS